MPTTLHSRLPLPIILSFVAGAFTSATLMYTTGYRLTPSSVVTSNLGPPDSTPLAQGQKAHGQSSQTIDNQTAQVSATNDSTYQTSEQPVGDQLTDATATTPYQGVPVNNAQPDPDDLIESTSDVSIAADIDMLRKAIQSLSLGHTQDLEAVTHAESLFVENVSASPQLQNAFLDIYSSLENGSEKDLLRSLLAASLGEEVESLLISNARNYQGSKKTDWLNLLQDKGVSGATTRRELMNFMPELTEPEHLGLAIRALAPSITSASERESIVNELSLYAAHSSDHVRSSAIETLAGWISDKEAYLLENALADPAPTVKSSALFATYTANVRTPAIKNTLISIMADDQQPVDLREAAHTALSNYSLNNEEHELFYEFTSRYNSIGGIPAAAKG